MSNFVYHVFSIANGINSLFYKPPYLRHYWERCGTELSVVLNLLFSFTLSTHCSSNRRKTLQTFLLTYRMKLLATLLNRGFFVCLFTAFFRSLSSSIYSCFSSSVLWLNLSTSSWRPTTFQGPLQPPTYSHWPDQPAQTEAAFYWHTKINISNPAWMQFNLKAYNKSQVIISELYVQRKSI